jgi:hypothetical protein
MTWFQIPDIGAADTAPANTTISFHHSLIREESLISKETLIREEPLVRVESLIREAAFPTDLFLIRTRVLIRPFLYKLSHQVSRIKARPGRPFTMHKIISMCGHHAPNMDGDRCNLLLYSYVVMGLCRTDDEIQLVGGVHHE